MADDTAEDIDQLNSTNNNMDQLDSTNNDMDQLDSKSNDFDQLNSTNNDMDQLNSTNNNMDQLNSTNNDMEQLDSTNNDMDQLDSTNNDMDQLDSTNNDIDIEEHDVMHNSYFKGLFPDLTLIKTEIQDGHDVSEKDQDHDSIIKASSPQPSTSAGVDDVIPDSTTDMYQEHGAACEMTRAADSPHMVTSTQEDAAPPAIANCIILGSKPTANCTIIGSKPTANCTIIGSKPTANCTIIGSKPTANCTIIGSKPTANCTIIGSKPTANCIIVGSRPTVSPSIDFQHCISATVSLQDWGHYLRDSRTYCRDCRTLFATVNALDAHKMHTHSFLVAVDRELRDASPEKPLPPIEEERIRRTKKETNCVLCTKSFENEDELIQHFYIHLNESLQCEVCKKTFKSKPLLNEHRKSMHAPEKTKTDQGTSKSTAKASKSTAEAVENSLKSKKMGYRCHCGCLFKLTRSLDEHCALIHGEEQPLSYKTASLEPRCDKCSKTFKSLVFFNRHVLKTHQAKAPPIPKASDDTDKREENIVIPKSTLFKCSKCNVHFINGTITSSHYKNCSGLADNVYDCARCNLSLKVSCEAAHAQQHRFGDNISVHEVAEEDLRLKILARCPKCLVHHSEQSIWSHLENCNAKSTDKFRCTICRIDIDKKVKDTHDFGHETLDLDVDDFIVVDYVEISVGRAGNKDRGFKLYLCSHCKCTITFRKHRSSMCHYRGACKKIRKSVCELCGLVVTEASLKRHMEYHKSINSYKLENFQFFNLLDNKPICPVPEYPSCKICKIHFHSNILLSQHHCKGTPYKKCKHCKLKFTNASYKLHKQFHKLDESIEDDTESSSEEEIDEKIVEKQGKKTKFRRYDIVRMFYCDSCKCYLHSTNRHWDAQGKCLKNTVYSSLCDLCGILCGNSGRGHRTFHEKHKNLTISKIEFLGMPGENPIRPPVPFYQRCNGCKVNFFSKRQLHFHHCGKDPFKICETCKVKFNHTAYGFHMQFHNYKMLDTSEERDFKEESATENADDDAFKEEEDMGEPIACEVILKEEESPIEEKKVNKFLFYECRYCKLAISLRTDVKYHFCKTSQPNRRYTCKICGLHLTKTILQNHNRSHETEPSFKRENFEMIPFTPLETGSKNILLFKCKECDVCMRDYTLPEHFKNESCRRQRRKPCRKCELKFAHENTHSNLHKKYPNLKRTNIDVTVVTSLQDYVDKVRRSSNKIYQCRRCKEILFSRAKVEEHKISCTTREDNVFYCPKCGLDIPDDEESLRNHEDYHNRNPGFVRNSFSLISFIGSTSKLKGTSAPVKIATKTSQKYILYQCNACKICFMSATSIKRHDDSEKCGDCRQIKCKKCGLMVSKHIEARHRARHLAPDYVRENMRIIAFENGRILPTNKTVVGARKFVTYDRKLKQINRAVTLYFCKRCDVHCMSVKSLSEHRAQAHKYTKETFPCSYCGLKFSKFALLYHTKVHHRLYGYKMENFIIKEIKEDERVIPKSITPEERKSNLVLNEELTSKSASRKRTHDGKLVETATTIYRCSCKLNFMCRSSFKEHVKDCDGTESKSGLKCSKCKLLFDANHLVKHSLKHHSSESDFKYNIVEENPLTFVMYRCGTCVSYFTEESKVAAHVKTCTRNDMERKKCVKCHLLIHSTMVKEHKTQHATSTNAETTSEIITYNAKANDEGNDKYTLYRCNTCDLHFKDKDQLESHLKETNFTTHYHYNFLLCKTCNLKISNYSLMEHLKKDHGIKNTDSYYTPRDVLLDKNLYYCETCEIYLLRKQTFQHHMSYNEEHINKDKLRCKPCNICGLVFSTISLGTHVRGHHEKLKLNLEDFNIITNKTFIDRARSSEKEEPKTVRRSRQKDVEISTNSESDSDSDNKSDATLNENPKRRRTNETFGQNDDHNRSETSSPKEIESKGKIDRITYYKCKNCDVFFLNKSNCMEHLNPHSKMPDYDFLKCKICKRNFEVDSLKLHMNHHKNALSSERVRIVQYEAEDGTDPTSQIDTTTSDVPKPSSSENSQSSDQGSTSLNNIKIEDKTEKSTKIDEVTSDDALEAGSDDENNSNNKFSCHLCKKKYKTDRARDMHVSLDHLDEEKSCPFCERTFNLSILNDLHLCMTDVTFTCCICGNSLPKHLLESHARNGCVK